MLLDKSIVLLMLLPFNKFHFVRGNYYVTRIFFVRKNIANFRGFVT